MRVLCARRSDQTIEGVACEVEFRGRVTDLEKALCLLVCLLSAWVYPSNRSRLRTPGHDGDSEQGLLGRFFEQKGPFSGLELEKQMFRASKRNAGKYSSLRQSKAISSPRGDS